MSMASILVMSQLIFRVTLKLKELVSASLMKSLGRLEGPLPKISILISKGSALIVIKNSSYVEPHKVEFDESRRRFMCRSILMVNMDDA